MATCLLCDRPARRLILVFEQQEIVERQAACLTHHAAVAAVAADRFPPPQYRVRTVGQPAEKKRRKLH